MTHDRTPTVSVVIPTFNRGHLVPNAIESVLGQTFAAHEIIVVDDGSTDDTSERVGRYEGRIRYVHQGNRGVSAAQNKGIELARGDWIAILGSDDLWSPTKLERQVEALAELGERFGACFTDCRFSGRSLDNRSAFELADLTSERATSPMHDLFRFILGRHAAIWVQSLLIRRSLLERLDGFDERMVVGEDTDLVFRAAFLTQFCFVNEVLVTIDRPEIRDVGLVEMFTRRDDRAFRSREHMYKKWLAMPELADPTIRQQVRASLRDMYYDWIVAKLYRSEWKEAMGVVERQRGRGERCTSILGTLALRAARKALSAARPHRQLRAQGRGHQGLGPDATLRERRP